MEGISSRQIDIQMVNGPCMHGVSQFCSSNGNRPINRSQLLITLIYQGLNFLKCITDTNVIVATFNLRSQRNIIND